MLSGLVPSSSESDSDQDADSSQRDLGAGDEVGGVEDSQCAVRTTEKKNLGTVRPTLGVQQRLTELRQERLRIAEKTEARRISALQKQAVKAGVCVCVVCGERPRISVLMSVIQMCVQ